MDKQVIGVPSETKEAEKRVALIPTSCRELIEQGFNINIQAGAGVGAGYSDELYQQAGCTIQPDAAALYNSSQLIVKVKEPLESDLANLTEQHTLFCYLHLAAEPSLVEKLKQIGGTSVAFETVVVDGKTPLLAPMSAIAGRLAVQIGTWYLHAPRGGRGTLIGGIKGMNEGKVTVVGAGVAGEEAAILASGMGAEVVVMDINQERLTQLQQQLPNIKPVISSPESIAEQLADTDLLVGAVYVIGRKAPQIITQQHIETMPAGAVAVDISIDQGGCMETSQPGTHDNPVFTAHAVIHSAITNLPAAAPRTASKALSRAIAPYVAQLAKQEWSAELTAAINVQAGELKIEL